MSHMMSNLFQKTSLLSTGEMYLFARRIRYNYIRFTRLLFI